MQGITLESLQDAPAAFKVVGDLLEHQGSYATQSSAVAAIAPKIGCIPETLGVWDRQAERDSGARDGATNAERERIKEF
jgi:transposase